jgi:hypothetical protein
MSKISMMITISIIRFPYSNITLLPEKPEKHELETSEKCIHPALAIEEDEEPADEEKSELEFCFA